MDYRVLINGTAIESGTALLQTTTTDILVPDSGISAGSILAKMGIPLDGKVSWINLEKSKSITY